MIAFRHVNQIEITGNVVTDSQFLSTLKVGLFICRQLTAVVNRASPFKLMYFVIHFILRALIWKLWPPLIMKLDDSIVSVKIKFRG